MGLENKSCLTPFAFTPFAFEVVRLFLSRNKNNKEKK
jgi:hypothetical protein